MSLPWPHLTSFGHGPLESGQALWEEMAFKQSHHCEHQIPLCCGPGLLVTPQSVASLLGTCLYDRLADVCISNFCVREGFSSYLGFRRVF